MNKLEKSLGHQGTKEGGGGGGGRRREEEVLAMRTGI